MANDLTFNQLATILNEVVSQATGESSLAPVDTSSFVALGQTALKVGYDPLATALSQVLSRTIFSNRPYAEHFRGLRVTNQQYGNHVRKLQVVDKEFEDDDAYSLVDGQSIDHYVVKKPEVIQTNFYGMEGYSDFITIYTYQLDNALSGPDEFASFLSMIIQNIRDRMTQARESMARMTLDNMIGAKAYNQDYFNLVTLYNDHTGLELDSQTVKAPEYYNDFVKFAYAKIRSISDMMTERSNLYHNKIGTKSIMRHTPYDRQKLYVTAGEMQEMSARVLSDTFNPSRLELMDYEPVNFWQSIESPDTVVVTPSVLNYSGAVIKGTEKTVSGIFAVLFDEEACGYTVMNERTERTPINARGMYYNQFWHDTKRYWNDMTENFVLFTLDDPE